MDTESETYAASEEEWWTTRALRAPALDLHLRDLTFGCLRTIRRVLRL